MINKNKDFMRKLTDEELLEKLWQFRMDVYIIANAVEDRLIEKMKEKKNVKKTEGSK